MMPVFPPATSREQGRRLEEKFTSLAEPILGGAKTRDLLGEIGRIDQLGDLRPVHADVRNLTARRCVPPAPQRQRLNFMASIKDPSDTHGRLIAADQVEGTTIYNPAGDNLGSVEDVMIDKVTGKIAYAVVGFGGFLGIGNRHYPMPWEKLKYDTNMGGFVVDLDKRTLEGAPSYSDTDTVGWEDRAWGKRVYDYYGTRPYWDMP